MDLGKVTDELSDAIGRAAQRVVLQTLKGDSGTVELSFAADMSAMRRGGAAFLREIDPADTGSDAAVWFALVHALGDCAGMRRVKLAISDPRAKGREVAVLDWLINGADIEEAIARAASVPPVDAPGSKIVPFSKRE